jgi:hypothetical protein
MRNDGSSEKAPKSKVRIVRWILTMLREVFELVAEVMRKSNTRWSLKNRSNSLLSRFQWNLSRTESSEKIAIHRKDSKRVS